jgi:hypothetical protein
VSRVGIKFEKNNFLREMSTDSFLFATKVFFSVRMQFDHFKTATEVSQVNEHQTQNARC